MSIQTSFALMPCNHFTSDEEYPCVCSICGIMTSLMLLINVSFERLVLEENMGKFLVKDNSFKFFGREGVVFDTKIE